MPIEQEKVTKINNKNTIKNEYCKLKTKIDYLATQQRFEELPVDGQSYHENWKSDWKLIYEERKNRER